MNKYHSMKKRNLISVDDKFVFELHTSLEARRHHMAQKDPKDLSRLGSSPPERLEKSLSAGPYWALQLRSHDRPVLGATMRRLTEQFNENSTDVDPETSGNSSDVLADDVAYDETSVSSSSSSSSYCFSYPNSQHHSPSPSISSAIVFSSESSQHVSFSVDSSSPVTTSSAIISAECTFSSPSGHERSSSFASEMSVESDDTTDEQNTPSGAFIHACTVGDIDTVRFMLTEPSEIEPDSTELFHMETGTTPRKSYCTRSNPTTPRGTCHADAGSQQSSPRISSCWSPKAASLLTTTDIADKMTPLHFAALNGHTQIVKLLLQAGAQLVAEDAVAATPLHHAASGGHHEVIAVMLGFLSPERRRNLLTSRNCYGYVPLHVALKRSNLEAADTLLLFGCDINFKKSDGDTALHLAADNGNVAVVEFLISHGASLSVKDRGGHTPLMRAAIAGELTIVEILMKAFQGSNPKLSCLPFALQANEKGRTLMHVAASQTATVKLLNLIILNSFPEDDSSNRGSWIKLCNYPDNFNSSTPLHIAAASNNINFFRTLNFFISPPSDSEDDREPAKDPKPSGADVQVHFDAQDAAGDTPLHIAVRANFKELAQLLCRCGADIRVKNLRKETPKKMMKKLGVIAGEGPKSPRWTWK